MIQIRQPAALLALFCALALALGSWPSPVRTIRVHLKQRASYPNVGKLLECARLSSYLNQTGPLADLSVWRQSNDLTPAVCAVARLEMLQNAFSPFIGLIQLGQPAQQFEVLFDTGSDVLWVTDERYRIEERAVSDSGVDYIRGHRNLFSSRLSRTCRPHNRISSVKIRYANDMEFNGKIMCDVVQLERHRSETMQIRDQCFVAVTTITNHGKTPYQPSFDGIVGLTWSRDTTSQTNLLDNMLARKLIPEPVFTTEFHRRTPRDLEQLKAPVTAGELVFGSIDHKRYTGDIVWAPVTGSHSWDIRVEHIKVVDDLGKTLAEACMHGCKAGVDTGTNYIIGPKVDVASLNKHLGFTPLPFGDIDCSIDDLRASSERGIRLVFQISGRELVFSSAAYSLYLSHLGQRLCVAAMRGFENNNGELPFWILGAPFIENFFTIFDYGNRRVGFAQRAPM